MVSAGRRTLAERVAARLFAERRAAPGGRALVAVSGGLDSVVLLHLLRFAPETVGLELVAAHFDHRMCPGSDEDARWIERLARAWRIPFEHGVADRPPASEAAARELRYAWLHHVQVRMAARWILTAHHADDQAETVLFRLARGTGVAGLRGIPARRGPLLRPLLGVWREELADYARAHGLDHREDPTNADLRFARNVLRHEALPALARAAPGARRALVRLARVAAREERAWRALLPGLVEEVTCGRGPNRIVLDRSVLLHWPEGVSARVLRSCARELGGALDEAGTRALIQFTREAASGRSQSLPGGVRVAREFERIVLGRAEPGAAERPLEIPTASPGEGTLEIGGRRLRARWSNAAAAGAPRAERDEVWFPLARLAFPLHIRGWRPGDRVRLLYGSKKLKKLLGEARIPAGERSRIPVLVDGRGRVLWVPGVARDAGMDTGMDAALGAGAEEEFLHVGIADDDGP